MSNFSINTLEDIINLFPADKQSTEKLVSNTIALAKEQLEQLYAIEHKKRTFENTCKKLDSIISCCNTSLSILKTLELLSPDGDMRKAASEAATILQNFIIDTITLNNKLYMIIKLFAQESHIIEKLTDYEKYFIKELIITYQKNGLILEPAIQDQVKAIKKKLAALELSFEANIASDNRALHVTAQDLSGCAQEFLNGLQRTQDNNYIVGVDYPTYFYVLENCTNGQTRKLLWQAFAQRAYPANKQVLLEVIALRDQLAKLLNFDDYASLNISGQMACSPGVVEGFLFNLLDRSKNKLAEEIKELKEQLPNEIQLTPYDTLNPWDMLYIKNAYKKKFLNINEELISQYFPLGHIVDEMLKIYGQFFGINFKKITSDKLWHESLEILEVYDSDTKEILGFIILDLFPRDNKFSHAAQETIIPALKDTNNNIVQVAVAVVMANFTKSTESKPALMTRNDVSTLFHEFGHALHAVLGATVLATQSGTAVKLDFVEMPSQMFEEWLWQPEVLKQISRHYVTAKELPDELINNILKTKNFDTGDWIYRQCYLSLISLEYYKAGAHKDIEAIQKELYNNIRSYLEYSDSDKFYASFGHLMEYGAQYYSYLWSKVFALDLFNTIKTHGMHNAEIGRKFRDLILGRGGSTQPDKLLVDFLGREPSADAFLRDLGI